MSKSNLAFSPAVTLVDGKPCTTSNEVASHFGKQHLHVMERIRALLADLPMSTNRIFDWLITPMPKAKAAPPIA